MLIFIKIFVVFIFYRCDVFAKVNLIEDSNVNKTTNFIGELLNDNNKKEFSSIQDVTVMKLSLSDNNQSDLFNEVLSETIKNYPVLLATFSYDFKVQKTRAPGFVIIFFNFEVRFLFINLLNQSFIITSLNSTNFFSTFWILVLMHVIVTILQPNSL